MQERASSIGAGSKHTQRVLLRSCVFYNVPPIVAVVFYRSKNRARTQTGWTKKKVNQSTQETREGVGMVELIFALGLLGSPPSPQQSSHRSTPSNDTWYRDWWFWWNCRILSLWVHFREGEQFTDMKYVCLTRVGPSNLLGRRRVGHFLIDNHRSPAECWLVYDGWDFHLVLPWRTPKGTDKPEQIPFLSICIWNGRALFGYSYFSRPGGRSGAVMGWPPCAQQWRYKALLVADVGIDSKDLKNSCQSLIFIPYSFLILLLDLFMFVCLFLYFTSML